MPGDGVDLEQVRADLRPDVRPSQEGRRWAKKYTVEARKRARERHQRLGKRAQELFQKHDADKSGVLSRDQVKAMLGDIAGGSGVSEEELEFIMRMRVDQRRDCLNQREAETAVEAWDCYQKEFAGGKAQGHLSDAFDAYDTNGSGKLEFDQIKALMRDLEGGRTKRAPRYVSDIDVEWLLAKADIVGDGALSGKEFPLALCAWYQKLVRHDEEVIGLGGSGSSCSVQ
mmetsp:Transcript_90901/g.257477  ORF Transcript_90901/g.257477 Transcript_90901/m.257477 type:complete len:228 (+) Transcript_90901:105-788(+)